MCFCFCLKSLISTVLFSSFRDRQTLTVGILVAKSVSGSAGHRAAISFCPANHCQPRAAAFVFPTSPLLYFSDLSICISSNSSSVFAPLNCCSDTPFPFSSYQHSTPSTSARNVSRKDFINSSTLISCHPQITVSPPPTSHPRTAGGLSTLLSTCHKSQCSRKTALCSLLQCNDLQFNAMFMIFS